MNKSAWNRLGAYLRETQLIGSIQNTLYWDQNTSMPIRGASWRGEQLSLLAKTIHSRQSSKQFLDLLNEARVEFEDDCKSGIVVQFEKVQKERNLELLSQDFTRQSSLDPDLVGLIAKAKSEGYNLWCQAKSDQDFCTFAPALQNLILLRKEQAKQINEPRSCWETLAQPFEPDITITRIQELFQPLRKRLPDLLEEVHSWRKTKRAEWDLDEKIQQELCDMLLKELSRDSSITSVARSPHPFSITLGPNDFRITTRVVQGQPLSCFLATAHEWGHSLYEQGLPSQTHQWFSWPLGQATSMGVHESQSLFWENRIVRSYGFSKRYFPAFSKLGAPIKSSTDLWKEMNPLEPGLNRVEADELSYGLHILIRTDLEIDLIEKGLPVEDLPKEWNKRYQELLGVTPKNDSQGCLQDVHWSEGLFGYFPSYLLGHLISAQLSEAMSFELNQSGFESIDPIAECIISGQFTTLIKWLRENVHLHGRQMNGEDLVKKVTGKSLSSNAFLSYLENKLELMSNIP